MFRSRFACQLAIFTLLFLATEAKASGKPSDAELAAITQRGVLLAEYDTAAWQATDAVTAAHPIEGRIGRYIARKTDAGWVVDFGRLNQTEDKFLVAYEAVQVGSPAKFEVRSFDPMKEDTAQNDVQVQASVIGQPEIVQGEKQADGTSATGVRGTIQDTITVNGKPLSGRVAQASGRMLRLRLDNAVAYGLPDVAVAFTGAALSRRLRGCAMLGDIGIEFLHLSVKSGIQKCIAPR